MKKLFTILVPIAIGILLTASVFAQTPQKMSYQAVIRDNSDVLVTNTQVGMKISILQASASGTVVYTETQTPTTNANGLVSIEIGSETGFSTIDWAGDIYFIKTETDPNGGTNYSITGTSQLLSVPYAFYAKTSETIAGGITETDPVFTEWDKSTGISITESQISDLGAYIETETDPRVPIGITPGEIQYWNGTEWAIVPAGNEGDIMTFISNTPTWVGESTGDGTVENPITGRVWIDRNLGASQVATSSTDADAYGDLYQWGRGTDGHEKRTSGTTTTLSSSDTPGHGDFIIIDYDPYDWRSPRNDDLWQGVSGINNPCPNGYRLPTKAEWQAELQSWSSSDAAGAFASPLKLTMAGDRDYSNGLISSGSNANYWSSTITTGYSMSCALGFGSSYASVGSGSIRAYGYSIRCIKD